MNTREIRRPPRRRLISTASALVLLWAVGVAVAPATIGAFGPGPGGHGPGGPGPQQNSTSLSLQVPASAPAGSGVSAVAVLRDYWGNPKAGQTVAVAVDGSYAGSAKTGWRGVASVAVPGSFIATAGTHSFTASFGGAWGLTASSARATLNALGATQGGTVGGSTGGTTPPPVKRVVTAGLAATTLTLEVPTGSVLGNDVTVTAILKTRAGAPIPGERIALVVDGVQVRSDKGDATGKAALVIPARDLIEARTYAVQVVFSGAHGLAASSATSTLTILSAAIQIKTVPPMPNLKFTLGTETALTGPDGVAALPVPKTGTYQLTADLNPDVSPNATVKASFVRWLDNIYTANRTIDVVGPATYVIGLRVAYRASIKFVDLNNQPVDPTLVEQAQFSTGTGTDDIILNSQTGAKDVWWTSASAVRFSTQLNSSPITYRTLSVKIHGAEVVNRGQQAWTPTENGVWTIQLLLYSMSIQTRDALFGMPVGGTLKLTYPDGVAVHEVVDADGRITFTNLPRGQYQLGLSAVAYSPPTPVALSRTQEATLRVITFLDVAVVLGIALLIGLGLLGRWIVLSRRIKRRSSPTASALA